MLFEPRIRDFYRLRIAPVQTLIAFESIYRRNNVYMSVFTKPLSQCNATDLRELLDSGAVENVRLEFKRDVPAKDETLKKLSSFANTFGGFVVIGAEAASADGRLISLPGVKPESGYKQRIVQWAFDGASPPINVAVSDAIPLSADGGQVCYVIYVPESEIAPHFLNGRKGVYVRTDEFSARFEPRLANDTELRFLLNRRQIITERRIQLADRASKRFLTYLRKRAPSATTLQLVPRIEICISPRFPALPLCQDSDLERLVRENLLAWRQTAFPRLGDGPITQHESILYLQAAEESSIFETNVWGTLFYGTEIGKAGTGINGIHMHHFIGYILASLHHAGRMLAALGSTGTVMIKISAGRSSEFHWFHFRVINRTREADRSSMTASLSKSKRLPRR